MNGHWSDLAQCLLLGPWRLTAAPSDRFRAFQIASGVYLAFYVLGHMDSVFIFARTYLDIDTDWDFATGAHGVTCALADEVIE